MKQSTKQHTKSTRVAPHSGASTAKIVKPTVKAQDLPDSKHYGKPPKTLQV